MDTTTGWMVGGLLMLVVLLGGAVAVLGARLHRQQREPEPLTGEPAPPPLQEQPPAPAPQPPPAPAPTEEFRREVVQGAQEAVGGTMRRILALTNNAAERLHEMQRSHGPDVLEDLLPIDHLLAQAQRRAQLLTVLCGSPPGQQRSPQLIARLVGAAQSRIHDYDRVRLSTRDTTTAMIGRVVEPLSAALAELLDNATRSSPPTAPVDVLITAEYHGVSVEIHDGGVGMPPDSLAQANQLLAHGEAEVQLTELGNPPRTGLAGCGVLAASYGFHVRLDAASSRGGLRAVVLVPHHLLTTLEPQQPEAAEEPAHRERPAAVERPPRHEQPAAARFEPPPEPPQDVPRHRQSEAEPEAGTTTSGLPKRRRTMTRSGDLSAPGGSSIGDTAGVRTKDMAKSLRGLQRATRGGSTDEDSASTTSTGTPGKDAPQ